MFRLIYVNTEFLNITYEYLIMLFYINLQDGKSVYLSHNFACFHYSLSQYDLYYKVLYHTNVCYSSTEFRKQV